MSFEQKRGELAEVDTPVAPDVATGGLHVGIFITSVVEFPAEVGVGFVEKVILADADPEKGWLGGEQFREFAVKVFVNRGFLFREYGGGEQAEKVPGYSFEMWSEWNPPIDSPAIARPSFLRIVR